MDYITKFIIDFVQILNEMSPYLLLGFLFAGILKVIFPQKFIDKYLAKNNFSSVIYSSLLGIPLPLCSCGVIPTGISFYKNGMGKGATVSFLISTPQTGVDSLLVTYSLLGLPFAILRPIIALCTGLLGGVMTNVFVKPMPISVEKVDKEEASSSSCSCGCEDSCNTQKHSKIYEMLKYAFVDFLQDISKWLIIGLLLAAFISVIIPNNFFENFIGNDFLEMIMVLVVAIPLYVCATSSVPIAAMLIIKGMSPGAALVFLMAGPATNAATITVLRNALGKKTMWIYIISIILGALFFGTIINNLLPQEWFTIIGDMHKHHHEMLPNWLEWASSILLVALIINGFIQKSRKNKKLITKNKAEEISITVNGMTCNHCKNSVEKQVSSMPNVKSANVILDKNKLIITGKNINIKNIKQEIESLGFECEDINE